MIIGQTMFSDQEGAALTFYSPWFPSNGNYASFVLDLLTISNAGKVVVEVQSKNSEDDDRLVEDAGYNFAWTSSAFSTAGLHPFTAGKSLAVTSQTDYGLLELVRFKFTVTSDNSAQGLVNARVLSPSFQTH